jgi:hypothetical protein
MRVLLILSALCFVDAASADDPDSRVLVVLPAMMQQHMLANMRDHLVAIGQIQEALAGGDFDSAAGIAEERLGMSSLESHGAAHMAHYMPQEMQLMGERMHRAASRFALVARDASVHRDVAPAMKSLSAITKQCVACHAAFRIR